MKSLKYIDRINKIHSLISSQKTGTPETFAKKLCLSRRKMYYELEFFKNCNAPIRYSKVSQTFYYVENFEINFDFNFTVTLESDTKTIFHISSKGVTNSITPNDSLFV